MEGTVCVLGSFMMDLVAYADRRPLPGETLLGNDFETFLGGKGFNQAIAARRAGSKVEMIGCVGEDAFGDQFLSAMSDEQIGMIGTQAISGNGTGVGLPVVESTGSNSIIVIPRVNEFVSVEYVEKYEEVISSSDVILLQLELSIDSAVRAAQIAKEHGVKVILNPAPFRKIDSFRNLVDVLVPNEVEFNAYIGSDRSFDEGIRYLEESFPGTAVVITLGEAGACIPESGEKTYIPAIPAQAIDTTGAGDVFCGYLASALATGKSLKEAVEISVAAASISVLSKGAAFSAPHLTDVMNSMLQRE